MFSREAAINSAPSLHDVAMVAVGSLLSNRRELQEAAKVFSHVLKQMDVYLRLESKYTSEGRRENVHTGL